MDNFPEVPPIFTPSVKFWELYVQKPGSSRVKILYIAPIIHAHYPWKLLAYKLKIIAKKGLEGLIDLKKPDQINSSFLK